MIDANAGFWVRQNIQFAGQLPKKKPVPTSGANALVGLFFIGAES